MSTHYAVLTFSTMYFKTLHKESLENKKYTICKYFKPK